MKAKKANKVILGLLILLIANTALAEINPFYVLKWNCTEEIGEAHGTTKEEMRDVVNRENLWGECLSLQLPNSVETWHGSATYIFGYRGEGVAILEKEYGCYSNEECNDGSDRTQDYCRYAGQPNSECIYRPFPRSPGVNDECSEDIDCDDDKWYTADYCSYPKLTTESTVCKHIENSTITGICPVFNPTEMTDGLMQLYAGKYSGNVGGNEDWRCNATPSSTFFAINSINTNGYCQCPRNTNYALIQGFMPTCINEMTYFPYTQVQVESNWDCMDEFTLAGGRHCLHFGENRIFELPFPMVIGGVPLNELRFSRGWVEYMQLNGNKLPYCCPNDTPQWWFFGIESQSKCFVALNMKKHSEEDIYEVHYQCDENKGIEEFLELAAVAVPVITVTGYIATMLYHATVGT